MYERCWVVRHSVAALEYEREAVECVSARTVLNATVSSYPTVALNNTAIAASDEALSMHCERVNALGRQHTH